MIEPLISIQIDGASRVFESGDVLSVAVQVDAVDPKEIQAVELSVLWHTEGKGDEDIGVHHFERRMADVYLRGHLHELHKFHTTLPVSPLSYDGVNVKIYWCVRMRLFLNRGRETVAEQRFQLGNVPTAHAVIESSGSDNRQPPANEKARQDTSA